MASDIPDRIRALVRQRERHRCARCTSPAPNGHIHHRRSRSVRDEHTHCPCNLLLLCWRCHLDVHANVVAAKSGGWIVSRFIAAPSQVQIRKRRIVWHNDCTGNITGAHAIK